jgi:carbonic anhydrase
MEYPVVTWIKGTPVCQEHVTWIVNADLLGIDEDEEEE